MKSVKISYLAALISFVFLLIKLLTLHFYTNAWWDAAVYIGMGKYIFTGGNIGLWEPSRPLVWPFLLGILWSLKLNPVIFGRLLTILLSFGIVILTYLIALKIADKKTALLAAIFAGFSPTFFFFSSNMLSDIPSTFFSLLAIYFLFRKRYLKSGLFFGIAFMTRFLQLFAFLLVITILLYRFFKKKEIISNIFNLIKGFSIPVSIYLLINFILYKNPIYPFVLQFILTKNTGWMYFEPFWFYISNLFRENIFYLFSLFGIYLMYIYKKKHQERKIIALVFLFYLLFFSLINHKEMRFIITFLPYMSILSSYGLAHIFSKISNKSLNRLSYHQSMIGGMTNLEKMRGDRASVSERACPQSPTGGVSEHFDKFFILIVILFISLSLRQYHTDEFHYHLLPFHEYVTKLEEKNGIWISNPSFLVYSDKRADKLIYDGFSSKQAIVLQKELPYAKHILINTCDIECPPTDKNCEVEKPKLISLVRSNLRQAYQSSFHKCELLIYSK